MTSPLTDASSADGQAISTAAVPALVHPAHPDGQWWRHAVIYQIYPRSWADDDGDGIGDLPGITSRLPYLADLGVDAIWLSPFYTSPQADAGYDVADYRDIDALFGSLADADQLITRAHELRIKVIVDLVPNHTSDEHAWFKAALAAAPGSPERDRYMFRDGTGPDGSRPPNNWESVFGGPAWTRVPDGQWYLHLFDAKQPDLNWLNEQVRDEFDSILRFWLDRGVDGFRVDVAHGLIKQEGLPDWSGHMGLLDGGETKARAPMWDQDGVHEIYRRWRKILDSYHTGNDSDDRIMCAEAWVDPAPRAAQYVRRDEFHQAFNFDFLQSPWRASDWREVIAASYAANDSVGAPTTWVLSNHDVIRHASRLGLPIGRTRPNGIGADDPQPDAVAGLRRARAATTMMLALPGSAYLYYGEELGLPDHTTMPNRFRQDPAWSRTKHKEKGRDGCRVPMPWEKDAPAFGFNSTGESWLPQPEIYGRDAVDQEQGDSDSTLSLYRRLLRKRRELQVGDGSLRFLDWGADVVAVEIESSRGRLVAVCNFGVEDFQLPSGATVLVASEPDATATLPTDTACWLSV